MYPELIFDDIATPNHGYLPLNDTEDLAKLRAMDRGLLSAGIQIWGYHFDSGVCGKHPSCPGVVRSTITDSCWVAPFYEHGWNSRTEDRTEKKTVGLLAMNAIRPRMNLWEQ
ncbi:hypothetical protein B0H17DRAFT_1127684 [Mycena rosella]|uniref:Uncharacterized protein n=1 Tax=Mycena rosella TaxID=1033263 RepID=A0AAD7E172_MYCRO|nr:hypothetical protein B0H17DRAFT_1127684 [Mycena rosella]